MRSAAWLFDVQRSMLDVRCSKRIPAPEFYGQFLHTTRIWITRNTQGYDRSHYPRPGRRHHPDHFIAPISKAACTPSSGRTFRVLFLPPSAGHRQTPMIPDDIREPRATGEHPKVVAIVNRPGLSPAGPADRSPTGEKRRLRETRRSESLLFPDTRKRPSKNPFTIASMAILKAYPTQNTWLKQTKEHWKNCPIYRRKYFNIAEIKTLIETANTQSYSGRAKDARA